jgi:hypothetical protein
MGFDTMRRYLLLIALCVIFFFLPLQVYTIGDNVGIGIQGATYRYQITVYGDSFILLPREIIYILSGILTGKSALSVAFWISGTVILTATLLYAFISVRDQDKPFYRQIAIGLVSACLGYLASSVAQYGFFFRSMAGTAFPIGIGVILFWTVVFYKYSDAILGDPTS